MHRGHRCLDVELRARHGGAVVDERAGLRAGGSSQVDASDHGDQSRSGRPRPPAVRRYAGTAAAVRLDDVSATLPMFPLGSVLFPGVIVPLRVFEDRYRALVHHLIREPDPAHRLFGSVGIREGYEVGDHGAQSLFRVGCRLQLTDVEAHEDGTFDIVAVGRDRIRLDRLDTTGPFPAGEVATMPPAESEVDPAVIQRALALFTAYRAAVTPYRGDPHPGDLPRDPTYLSWTLAAVAPLAMPDRQALLESDDTTGRLLMVSEMLRSELRAMNAIPSLPATEVARTRWSPN